MTIIVRALEEPDIDETIEVMKEAWNYAYDTWEKGHYPIEAHDFDMSLNTPERYTATMEYEHGFFFIAEIFSDNGIAELDRTVDEDDTEENSYIFSSKPTV